MKTTLVKYQSQPVSVGVGKYSFEIVNNEITHSECQLAGAKFNNKEDEYHQAYEKAQQAWLNQSFDNTENNY